MFCFELLMCAVCISNIKDKAKHTHTTYTLPFSSVGITKMDVACGLVTHCTDMVIINDMKDTHAHLRHNSHVSDHTEIASHVHHSIIRGYLCVCGFVCEDNCALVTMPTLKENLWCVHRIEKTANRRKGETRKQKKSEWKKEDRSRNHQKRDNKLTVTENKIELLFLDDFLYKHLESRSPALDLHIKLCWNNKTSKRIWYTLVLRWSVWCSSDVIFFDCEVFGADWGICGKKNKKRSASLCFYWFR